MNLAKDIRDRERGGRAQVTVVEGDDERSSEEAMKMMIQALGEKNKSKMPSQMKLWMRNSRLPWNSFSEFYSLNHKLKHVLKNMYSN